MAVSENLTAKPNFLRTGYYYGVNGHIYLNYHSYYAWTRVLTEDLLVLTLGSTPRQILVEAHTAPGFGFAIRCVVRAE